MENTFYFFICLFLATTSGAQGTTLSIAKLLNIYSHKQMLNFGMADAMKFPWGTWIKEVDQSIALYL